MARTGPPGRRGCVSRNLCVSESRNLSPNVLDTNLLPLAAHHKGHVDHGVGQELHVVVLVGEGVAVLQQDDHQQKKCLTINKNGQEC